MNGQNEQPPAVNPPSPYDELAKRVAELERKLAELERTVHDLPHHYYGGGIGGHGFG